MTDPFADVRDKRMSELNTEQLDRASELWLRTNANPDSGNAYWVTHVRTLLRVIDRLRHEVAKLQARTLDRRTPED